MSVPILQTRARSRANCFSGKVTRLEEEEKKEDDEERRWRKKIRDFKRKELLN